MNIQNICMIILGAISLLALIDLRIKSKELNNLRDTFQRNPLHKQTQNNDLKIENSDNQTIILQINELKNQKSFSNFLLVIIAIELLFIVLIICRLYSNAYGIDDSAFKLFALF